MIPVAKAYKLILEHTKPYPVELIPLSQAHGRLLREDIYADRPQPAFNKSLMDGIAINMDAWRQGVRSFIIEAILPAGQDPKPLKRSNGCIQIMTGAVIPKGCNAVIPIEHVVIENNHAMTTGLYAVNVGQNIRAIGSDAKKGDVLLKKGCILDAPHIGVCANVGKEKIKVSSMINIAIISTGDELVSLQSQIKSHQTRISNAYALKSMLEQAHLAQAQLFHLVDDPASMHKKLKLIFSKFNIIVISGGVSMGEFDFVPKVLKQLGIKEIFHKVLQKPGKPMWFGVGKGNKVVFGLPGNPVSTQICAYRYLIPFLKKSAGYQRAFFFNVKLASQVSRIKDMTQFIPVKINNHNGELFAYSITMNGSGDFASLVNADGFIEYDSETKESIRPYFSWRL